MTDTQNSPIKHDSHGLEIARLTTPVVIKHGRAYDRENNVVESIENFSEFRHYIEPKPGFLNEDEILKYAKNSQAASKIRLQNGIGTFDDKFMINKSLPWFLGLYYVVLACFSVPILYYSGGFLIVLFILAVVPLAYAFYVFNVKSYAYIPQERQIPKSKSRDIPAPKPQAAQPVLGIPSLKKYEGKINDLMILFDAKEKAVRELIEKRFEPPQITYDKFMSSVDSCHKVFYSNADAALNIINLAAEDTPRVDKELEDKINSLEAIIDQVEDLTNELVINMSSEKNSNEDLKNVLKDMEDLVDSVKDY